MLALDLSTGRKEVCAKYLDFCVAMYSEKSHSGMWLIKKDS